MLGRVRNLFRDQAIYGFGSIATSIVSLLLLPVFTRYLSAADYGVLALLVSIEAVTKIAFRWGVDTAFMRFYYDSADQRARQRLASTIFLFLFAANGVLLAGGLAASGPLSRLIFGSSQATPLIALTIANTFVTGFFFMPFHVMRIEQRSRQFIALTFVQAAGTIGARLVLVIGFGMGVLGVVLADVLVTALFALLILPWFVRLLRPVFSRAILADALRFGLPRVPHSFAQQVIGYADRYFLNAYGTLRDVGLYSIGSSFGQALKLFLSAFETAWTPFFLNAMREPDAKPIYSLVTTYATALFVLLVTGLCAIAPDVVRLFTDRSFFTSAGDFHDAAAVTPWIALGILFQGFYVLGSIGLVIKKRTTPYPIATGIAALTSLVANVILIPRFGGIGAAWANMTAYVTLAVVTGIFSWSIYPIPYEWSRLARIALAGAVGYTLSAVVPVSASLWLSLIEHGTLAVAGYVVVLYVSRFFHPGELRELRDIQMRAMRGPASPAAVAEAPVVSPDSPDPRR